MKVEDIWKDVKTTHGFDRCQMVMAKAPKPTAHCMKDCRTLCKENKCQTYGKSWACPPGAGTEEDCLGVVHQYDKAIIIYQRIEGVDVDDRELVKSYSYEHQGLCRRLANAMRQNGYEDILPLSDGGCGYCGTCAYPAPCRFPKQMVPSVSAFGICMDEYLQTVGLSMTFEKKAFTLYSMILYR